MFQALKDLGVKYFASDMDSHYGEDVADRFLSEEQKNQIPVLKEMCNFTNRYNWYGYDATILYEVTGFEQKQEQLEGFNKQARYILNDCCN